MFFYRHRHKRSDDSEKLRSSHLQLLLGFGRPQTGFSDDDLFGVFFCHNRSHKTHLSLFCRNRKHRRSIRCARARALLLSRFSPLVVRRRGQGVRRAICNTDVSNTKLSVVPFLLFLLGPGQVLV